MNNKKENGLRLFGFDMSKKEAKVVRVDIKTNIEGKRRNRIPKNILVKTI